MINKHQKGDVPINGDTLVQLNSRVRVVARAKRTFCLWDDNRFTSFMYNAWRITCINDVPLCLCSGGLRVTCEYMAHQEGVMCEEVQILSESKEDVCVKVKVHARVMGKWRILTAKLANNRVMVLVIFWDTVLNDTLNEVRLFAALYWRSGANID